MLIFIRFGNLPPTGKSRNHLINQNEPGVSCYEALVRNSRVQIILPKLNTTGLVSLSGVNDRPVYRVEGNIIGTGSDGEPLLSPCRILGQLLSKDGSVAVTRNKKEAETNKGEQMKTHDDLIKKIAEILNCVSRESASDTPDFILAEHMVESLEAFEKASRAREQWYGREVKELCGDSAV